jgi:hypothetical protein
MSFENDHTKEGESAMSEAIQAYPLQWPAGWKRTPTHQRERAQFNKKVPQYRNDPQTGRTVHAYNRKQELSMFDATNRVLDELGRMGMTREDIVISTNVELRLDGLPKSNRRAPDDPGVAVYWRKGKQSRCIAVDLYDRVEDNLAAIAATLDALRAIERHGGATILDRAFQGFTALPAPSSWWQELGLSGPDATREQVEEAHRRLIMKHHPDRAGGDDEKAARINRARDQGFEAIQ